jgi:hypothetical protein
MNSASTFSILSFSIFFSLRESTSSTTDLISGCVPATVLQAGCLVRVNSLKDFQ